MRERTSLWRSRGLQALVGVTILGFASYCLTLASLPAYAVAGGARESTAGVVTAVRLWLRHDGPGARAVKYR